MYKNFVILFFLFTACANHRYTDSRVIRSIGVTDKISDLENVGYVTSKDCAWKFLGMNFGTKPTVGDAFVNAISLNNKTMSESLGEEFSESSKINNSKIKLLTNIQTVPEGWNILLVGKECLKLRAVAYR